jgi:CheY-like chemotaxis protein
VNSWVDSAGERPRAVVLDENPSLQYFMREALTWLEGFAIEVACPCAAAVNLVCRTRPDIVIIDPTIGSVHIDWNLVAMLRQCPQTRSIPMLVYLTTASDPVVIAAASQYGVFLLEKPFELDALIDVIHKALRPRSTSGHREKALRRNVCANRW